MSLAIKQESYAALSYEAEGYLMIKKLRIENFRCFKSTSIEGFRRVNIIVGKNAVGKTALLESIKLGLDGLPGTLPWLNQIRTIPTVNLPNSTQEQFEDQFLGFFHLLESQGEIVISIDDSKHRTAKVRVHFDPSKIATMQPQPMGFQPPQAVPAVPPTTIIPLAFDRIDFEGKKDTLIATVLPNGQMFLQPGKHLGIASGLISITYYGGPGENAMWLSQMSIEKRSDEVKQAIRKHFSLISDVTSETPLPGLSMLYADIPSLPQKIALSLVSAGISRLFTMILAVVQYKRGAVLIDEIENGIYFEQYPQIWETLIDLAKHHDTQLFISTHSLECLRGSLETIKANEDDFLILRLEKENGLPKITPIEGKFIEAAIEQGFDVR